MQPLSAPVRFGYRFALRGDVSIRRCEQCSRVHRCATGGACQQGRGDRYKCREASDRASVFMQEQLRASQEQKQTIEKQEKELEKVKEALGIALSKERVASETRAELKPEEPAPKPEKSAPKPEKPARTSEEPAPTPDKKKEEKPKEEGLVEDYRR